MKQWRVQCQNWGLNLYKCKIGEKVKEDNVSVKLVMIFPKKKQILRKRDCERLYAKVT